MRHLGGLPPFAPFAPFALFAPVALFALVATTLRAAEPPKVEPLVLKVAAASDLAFAFKDIGEAFEKKYEPYVKVSLSMGSTGQFAKQIIEGAPFHVFAAANVSFVDDTVRAGVCDGTTKQLYGQGRLVLWSNKALRLSAPGDLAGLVDKKYVKIAIANPEHAPYGKAAQEAMIKAGVWDKVKDRIVYGENIQQTLKFAQSGNAEVAIVALSLALSTKDGDYKPVDPRLHNEINQAIVVCTDELEREHNISRWFVDYVASQEGRAIMKRYGFVLPGDT